MKKKDKVPGPKVVALMSLPRLAWTDNWSCSLSALIPLGIPLQLVSGAYWGKSLATGLEQILRTDAEYALTIDYDSVYDVEDVKKLIDLMDKHPEADAIVPIQMRRECEELLFSDSDTEKTVIVRSDEFTHDLRPIINGHFGLTLFRVSALREFPKPWFQHKVDSNGEVEIDADIWFWRKWKASGRSAFLATGVPIGHLELLIAWPAHDLTTMYQRVSEYGRVGRVPGVWAHDVENKFDPFEYGLPVDPFSAQFALEAYKRNEYSQSGEDGILERIFQLVPPKNKWVLEIGAHNGIASSNSKKLIDEGWSAVLIECDKGRFDQLQAVHKDNPNVHCINDKVRSLDDVLPNTPIPEDFDLCVIDIDGQDYYMWNRLLNYRPRVVVCEYDYRRDPEFIPEMGGTHQAGRKAIYDLAYSKYYTPVFDTGLNWICLRNDLYLEFEKRRLSVPLEQLEEEPVAVLEE